MIDSMLFAVLVGLMLAAYWDSRPQFQFLLTALWKQAIAYEPTKPTLAYLSRRNGGKGSRRRGSKRKIGPNEWELRGELPRALNGSRRRTYEVFHGSSREADRRLAEILDEIDTLSPGERPKTINELLDRWLSSEVENTVREVTFLDYQRRANTYVRPLIGHMKLADFTLARAEDFRNELLRQKVKPRRSRNRKGRKQAPRTLSDTTVNSAIKILSMGLNYARRHGYVATNVLQDLKRRQSTGQGSQQRRTLTAAELKTFMEAARGNYWYALFALLTNTGLRPSEALGLAWKNIDFDGGWIHVERKLSILPDGMYRFDPPKTRSSQRKVPISPGLRRVLLAHLSRQQYLRAYDPNLDLVFGTLDGQPADSKNVLNRHLKPIALKAGLGDDVTLYALRRTFMTLATNDTRRPKLTSRVMGHTDVSFSQNVYENPEDEALRETTRAMDPFLGEDDEGEECKDAEGVAEAAD